MIERGELKRDGYQCNSICLAGRWDFDTEEQYSDYMSTKEALPKAAFQYGVKMQDGRKTRKHKTEKNEKAELDREWNKIQVNIICFFFFQSDNDSNFLCCIFRILSKSARAKVARAPVTAANQSSRCPSISRTILCFFRIILLRFNLFVANFFTNKRRWE